MPLRSASITDVSTLLRAAATEIKQSFPTVEELRILHSLAFPSQLPLFR